MELLTQIARGIQGYAWTVLWMGAVLTILELVLPRSKFTIVSRLRGIAFWAVYILVSASLLALFAALRQHLPYQPLVTLHLADWFKSSDSMFMRGLGLLAPVFIARIVLEFFYYWCHRLQHTIPFLWRFHAVHHSIEDMSAFNSAHHVTEEVLRTFLVTLPMSLLVNPEPGPILPIIATLIGMHAFYEHSSTRLHFGIFRYIVADNVYHRTHHSIEPRHWNKNYGSFTPIWDIIFGTVYHPRRGEWPETGVQGQPQPRTVREFVAAPFRRRKARAAQERAAEPFVSTEVATATI